MSLFTTSVTLVARGLQIGRDEHGRPVYGPPTRTQHPAWFEPASQDEDIQQGEQYQSTYRLFVPLDVDVTGADAVELPGLAGEFELIGDPGLQPGGFVVEGYQIATVRKVRG